MPNKRGVTLAEILITLITVGIIAALTVPSLIQNVQDNINRSAWKTAYANFDQATKRIVIDYGGSFKGIFENNNDLGNKYKEYMTYTKTCLEGTSQGDCWHASGVIKSYANPNSVITTHWQNGSSFMLNNGMLVYFFSVDKDCNNDDCGDIVIDVNGFKKPNRIGYDIFGITIYTNKVKPWGDGNNCSSWGEGCSSYYLLH
ncbi:MAG: hypothetical protein A2104_02445 [Candidatus Melainabacteria bacterium GWF2_32_7]|nr:MAG: hypothetical protein A2104_02445 [Candidatus Melainabacteria bacterium GWF2_32_7]